MKRFIVTCMLAVILPIGTTVYANEVKDQNINTNKNIENSIYVKKNIKLKAESLEFIDEEGNYKDEFKLDNKGKNSLYTLEKKTDLQYEVFDALDNEEYKYVSSFNTYEEALECVELEVKGKTEKFTNLGIVDSNGTIVYVQKSMARIVKFVNGNEYKGYDKVTDIYKNQSLTGESAYINHGYVDDAPIIDNNGRAVKVELAGYTGWLKSSGYDGKNYDVVILPLNHVKNPSYYKKVNGELIRYISSDIRNYGEGSSITLGPAPSFMKEGTKYYSYDGNYFYNSLSVLLNDVRYDHNKNSVNYSNPYYNYYNYLPFRSKTNYSASQIDAYINANTNPKSKLRGMGQAFIEAQNKYGVNALSILGVAINESGWGMSAIAQEKNNIFGMKAVDVSPGQSATEFASPKDSIIEFAKYYISKGYADPQDWRYFGGFLGNKNLGANVKYASDPFWAEKASSYASKMDKSTGKRKDYNYYQLGITTTEVNVRSYEGELYYTTKKGTPIIILNTLNDKYRVYGDRNTSISTGEFVGNYNWKKFSFLPQTYVKKVNKGTQKDIFKDVTHGYWAKDEIEHFAIKGYVQGYDDGRFGPNNSITRAEFIKMINKYFGFKAKVSKENFVDVSSKDWWYSEILIALKAGYIESKNKEFRPNDPITREEVASIVTTIKKNKDNNLDKLKTYKDKQHVSQWAKSSVEGAIEAGYMGKGSNMFNPKKNITRAETIVTLYRIK